jgi:hypothetical protein
MAENLYTEYFLGLLGQIKLLHWCTPKYAIHIALDKLHSSLSENIDKFMEVYIGKYDKQPIDLFKISMEATSDYNIVKDYLIAHRENIKKLRNNFKSASDLQNILDEISANINQAIYLINLE